MVSRVHMAIFERHEALSTEQNGTCARKSGVITSLVTRMPVSTGCTMRCNVCLMRCGVARCGIMLTDSILSTLSQNENQR